MNVTHEIIRIIAQKLADGGITDDFDNVRDCVTLWADVLFRLSGPGEILSVWVRFHPPKYRQSHGIEAINITLDGQDVKMRANRLPGRGEWSYTLADEGCFDCVVGRVSAACAEKIAWGSEFYKAAK